MKNDKDAFSKADAVGRLTAREKEVFHMLLKGMKAKDIAAANAISIWGANYFTKQVYRKLKVRSKVELVLRYIEFGQAEKKENKD